MKVSRDFQLPGRSPIHATNGMAATSHPLATLTAVAILGYGGNAVDAGIAAAAVLAVVEPQSTGLGGDAFALYAPSGAGRVIALNGSGRAPRALDAGWLRERGFSSVPPDSPHAVTIPGVVDAWDRLRQDHGTMEMEELLLPAIAYAEEGFPVHARVALDWAANAAKLARDENARDALLTSAGRAPEAGRIFRQPRLAATLREIAARGRDGFYLGPVADDMVRYLNGLGGVHTAEDFALTRAEYVEPIRSDYRGYDVYQCPPNGQGVAALMMLNALRGYDLAALDPLGPERFHLEAETTRLAFEARDALIGDPAYADMPIGDLLSEDFAARLRGEIDLDRPGRSPPGGQVPAHPETVYLTVVDRDRNAFSFINSIFYSFGSGLMSPATGVVLQNRGAGFVLDDGHPNMLEGGKRPLHTIIPALVLKQGRAVLPFGVMHGQYQPVGQVHVLTNIVDYGMDVQSALDCARGFSFRSVYELEKTVPPRTASRLAAMGHDVRPAATPWGGGQAIWIDWDEGVLTGGSDPRKDGCALGH